MHRTATIIAALAGLSFVGLPAFGQTLAPAEHRIGIRKTTGFAEFYDVATDQTFVPRGNNYVLLQTDATKRYVISGLFLPEYHDPARIEADFEHMRAFGYNSVRTFIDLCLGENCIADVGGGLRDDFMDNVASFLRTAKKHDIQVLFTANWLPDVGGYSDAHLSCKPTFDHGNCLLLSPEGVAGYRRLFVDFIQGLIDRNAPLEMILGYQLRNEVFFEDNQPPLSFSSGEVTTANGETYDMASQSDKDRMLDDGLIFWANNVRDAIRTLDPTALVTAGFFPPSEPHDWRPGDYRLVRTREILRRSNLDFLDFHGYPGEGITIEKMAENYGMLGFDDKPIVLGEFGAFTHTYPDPANAAAALQRWRAGACQQGFDGYFHWVWDPSALPSVGDNTWGPLEGTGELVRALAPAYQPDPCSDGVIQNLALGKPAVASQSLGAAPPGRAFDGNVDEGWGAGGGPPQWIEVDLGAAETIGRMTLRVDQFPAGETVHQISGRATPSGPEVLLHTFSQGTDFGDWLEVQPDEAWDGFRYIRVATIVSPSWVSWLEIEIYPPDTSAVLPLPPALIGPADREDQLPTMPTLSWSEVLDADRYHVQVADAGRFGKLIFERDDLTTTSAQVGPLADNADYFWRVRAFKDIGASPWSAERRLTVGTVVHVGLENKDLPSSIRVSEAHPNPFRQATSLFVDLDRDDEVTFEIFDVLGRRVDVVVSTRFPSGRHRLSWHPGAIPSGTYFYRLTIDNSRRTGRLLFLKR